MADWLDHAFSVEREIDFAPEDLELLERLADFLVRRRMAEAAQMALETARPLNFLGAQALSFLRPFVNMIFRERKDFDRFAELLEDRATIGRMIDILEKRINPASVDGEND